MRFQNFDIVISMVLSLFETCKKTGGPCVYDDGTTESGYDFTFFVCENLDRNIMKYFSNEEGTLSSTVFLTHASRMVLL